MHSGSDYTHGGLSSIGTWAFLHSHAALPHTFITTYYIDQTFLHSGYSSCLLCILDRIIHVGDFLACWLLCPLCFAVQAHKVYRSYSLTLGFAYPSCLGMVLGWLPCRGVFRLTARTLISLVTLCCGVYLLKAPCIHIHSCMYIHTKCIHMTCRSELHENKTCLPSVY